MLDESVPNLPVSVPDEPVATVPEAIRRFSTCRWHKPGEGAQPAHCVHREVLSMAGVAGFSAESWCPDCEFYKLRRVPRRPSFSR
jgi:hypothetical protein